eukprot:CAMPEP_0170079370 /NCGR_PEP_ID=MMETSP0019_2-20121128/15767_1 /TAXON_ID=98059 /ORGANISM="Dinobryon sp., Strain UTEXLB2267" /LENGTH=432 /DNA_ID=CAMNT_0010292791 /DNA_START=236 /DNA_END=1534 /DNA_ORIENTATION=+
MPSLSTYQYICNKFNITKDTLFAVSEDVLYDFTTATMVSVYGLAGKDLSYSTKTLNRLIDEANKTLLSDKAVPHLVEDMKWESITTSKHRKYLPQSLPEITVENTVHDFLCKFKTLPCKKIGYHDYRKCENFHNSKDLRRNPYEVIYGENDVGGVEKAYHPLIFRTLMCTNPQKCEWGDEFCAFAHHPNQLRDTKTIIYPPQTTPPKPQLKDFHLLSHTLPAPATARQTKLNTCADSKLVHWVDATPRKVQTVKERLYFNFKQFHVLRQSEDLMKDMKQIARDNFCELVQLFSKPIETKGIALTNIATNADPDSEAAFELQGLRECIHQARELMVDAINRFCSNKKKVFSCTTATFHPSTMKVLQDYLRDTKDFGGDFALFDCSANCTVTVSGLLKNKEAIMMTKRLIDELIERKQLSTVIQCVGCMDLMPS